MAPRATMTHPPISVVATLSALLISAACLFVTTPRAFAQEETPPQPAPNQSLFESVKLSQWSSIPRHAGKYPPLQLAWQKVDAVTDVTGVWPHPLAPSRALLATATGLFLTQDAGQSFKPLPQASTDKLGTVTDIAFPSDNHDAFLVATKKKGIWITTDNGNSFKQLASKATGLAGDAVVSLEFHAGDVTGRTLLACHGESAAGLSRSADGGHTWDILHKEHHLFKTFTARVATEGICVVAAKVADPEAQGLYLMPSVSEPWQEIIREAVCTSFASPLMGDDSILVSTADRGLFRIARAGGVVKRIGPADIDTWAAVGVTWGPTADSQVIFAFDPKKLGMVAWATASVAQSAELLYAQPISGDPVPHSRGLYTNSIIREGAQLRASADGSVFYASVNSMLYRAARAGGPVQVLQASLRPAVNRFDPMNQQSSLDQVREALAAFPKNRNLVDAGNTMLAALKIHDQAMSQQRIIVSATVRNSAAKPPTVTVDLSRLGLPPTSPLFDDGQHDDGAPNDGVYAAAFPLRLLMYHRPEKDWRQPWPGIVGLTVSAADENGALAGAVIPYSIVNTSDGVQFWERDNYYEIGVEQGKVKRGTAVSAQGKKRGVLLGVELPGPWRCRLGGSRKNLDISGAAALVLNIKTTEDCADEIFLQLRDEPVFSQPVTTPAIPLLAEGFVPAKKFTPAYQRIVIPMKRLLKDAGDFQPGIMHSIILSGKAGKPVQIMIDQVIFSYVEPAEKVKVTR